MHLVKVLTTILFIVVLGTIVINKNKLDLLKSFDTNNIFGLVSKNNISDNLNITFDDINNKVSQIFNTNKPYLCTYSYNNNDKKVNGELYIENGNLLNKTYYTGDTENIVVNHHLYYENYLYTWGDDIMAIKLAVPNLFFNDSDENIDFKKLGISTGLNLVCNLQDSEESVVKVPDDIDFLDVEQKVDNVNQGINNASKEIENKVKEIDNSISKACEVCYNLPTENLINECLRITNCKK